MEDFSLNYSKKKNNDQKENAGMKSGDDAEMSMSVSPICNGVMGEKYAFVTFSDGKRNAEGRIPECIITKSRGFSEEEVNALALYMKANLAMLKGMAKSVNVVSAFMGDKK